MTKCPKCDLQWDPPCDQTACIELFGECISCRRFELTEDEIKQIQSSAALERKAENARELGLDYEPDWKEEYQKAVDLHCLTLDELREADAWIKNLEKLIANQDKILESQTARIVELQEHIDNFDGEDR
jgi:hypothetical protein